METIVPSAIAPIKMILTVNERVIVRALDGLPDADLWRQPSGLGNPIGWILGHITQTRAGMLALVGDRVETGWGTLFTRGATLRDASAYPSRAAIDAVWIDFAARLHEALPRMSEAQLAAAAIRSPVPAVKTLGDQLAFLAFHEAYHVGQIGYIRRALGHPGVAG